MLTIHLEAAGRTDIGLRRGRNEDSLYIGRSLFAVADGLGGHVAGNVASETAIEALQTHDQPVEPDHLPLALGRAVMAANEALRRRIRAEPELAGMGTTLVTVLFAGSSAALANVGDSRAYLRRRDPASGRSAFSQITEDHTFGHLLADASSIPAFEERLCRFVDGRIDGRSPDIKVWDLRPGDRFLLCSDGVSSFVPKPLLQEAMESTGTASAIVDRLVSLALENGGPDNITALVIDVVAG